MKIFIRLVLSILTVLVVLLVLVTSFFLYNKNQGYLTYVFNYTGFINTGSSMLPKFKPGDLIIIKKEKSYQIDEIISYISADNYITTHRIIDIKNDTYITKGDNNKFIDGRPVESDEIYGRLMLIIPGVGTLLSYIWQYKYLLLAIVITIPVLVGITLRIRGQHVR
ncbi:MAG: signal peptidase I [Bacilli bacterium]|nr:signal peptidase I [Bacilli bacterium]